MLVKNSRGQMSLEMIIGLLILLVLAAVVIKIMLTYLSPEKVPTKPEAELARREFLGKCEKLCTDFINTKSLEYCYTYWQGDDWNGNGMPNELIRVGTKVRWDVCEDRIYCFLLTSCEWATGKLTPEKCRVLLCNSFLEKYDGNRVLASRALMDDIRPGSCTLPNVTADNWYVSKFSNYWCIR